MSEANPSERYDYKQNTQSTQSRIDPLSMCDRQKAMKEEFTSVMQDCPYYCERVRSRCLVDPHVIFLPECTGRSFSNGICCPKIIQSSVDGLIRAET